MRVPFDLRKTGRRRHLLYHDDEGHEVQEQERCRALHGEAGNRWELYELLRCVPGTRQRPKLLHDGHHDEYDDNDGFVRRGLQRRNVPRRRPSMRVRLYNLLWML